MVNTMVIESMKKKDWKQVREIYIDGIKTGNATFETQAPSWEQWNKKYLESCRLVIKDEDSVIGWAALLPVSSKAAFYGVAELSIYLSKSSRGKGAGTKLLGALIEESEGQGFWTLQSGVFPENTASIQLHMKHGFREVGTRKRIGKLNGIWRDVIMLERRSEIVAID